MLFSDLCRILSRDNADCHLQNRTKKAVAKKEKYDACSFSYSQMLTHRGPLHFLFLVRSPYAPRSLRLDLRIFGLLFLSRPPAKFNLVFESEKKVVRYFFYASLPYLIDPGRLLPIASIS